MKNTNKTEQKQRPRKTSPYKKPCLINHGSIAKVTAGTDGSAVDISDPFTSQPR